jgi:hypothetical protein
VDEVYRVRGLFWIRSTSFFLSSALHAEDEYENAINRYSETEPNAAAQRLERSHIPASALKLSPMRLQSGRRQT